MSAAPLNPSPLNPSQIAERLSTAGLADAATLRTGKHPCIEVAPQRWLAAATFLKSDPALRFDWLANLTGLDYVAKGQLAVCYDLFSTVHGHRFAVKVFVPRSAPAIDSACAVWRAADWNERETYDLFGITFTGHPDLRRIVMADDWVGHPLLKDYEFPRHYNGIPGSVELDWQQERGPLDPPADATAPAPSAK